MNPPFTREEQDFARSVKRLATGVEKLVEILERIEDKFANQK